MDNDRLLKNRFSDLAQRAWERGIFVYSDFLNVNEQSELLKLRLPTSLELFGGYEAAERKLAIFGTSQDAGCDPAPPVAYIEIRPVNEKFADSLTHRDFLGSLMGLGVKREAMGDIIIRDSAAALICLDTIAEYISLNLEYVKHTRVTCRRVDALPEYTVPTLKYSEIITASDRLDVLIAAVFKLSRKEAALLFSDGRVFLDGRAISDTSARPHIGAVVSVRGKGRFIYDGEVRITKKNRSVTAIRLY